jgi:hypothetical protein
MWKSVSSVTAEADHPGDELDPGDEGVLLPQRPA